VTIEDTRRLKLFEKSFKIQFAADAAAAAAAISIAK
jgi:hypothetical protein